ncbi:transposase, partial [Lactococcus lactis]
PNKLYKGYRIFANDGSELNIPYNEKESDTHYRVGKFGKPVGSLHLNALYDPLNKHYVAVDFQKIKQLNERKSLCQIVDDFDFT